MELWCDHVGGLQLWAETVQGEAKLGLSWIEVTSWAPALKLVDRHTMKLRFPFPLVDAFTSLRQGTTQQAHFHFMEGTDWIAWILQHCVHLRERKQKTKQIHLDLNQSRPSL